MIPVIADCFIFQIDIGGSSSTGPRALSKRAAHNSIFSILFPTFLRTVAQFPVFPPLLARPVLGHTVKELLHSRGLKSRSVGSFRELTPGLLPDRLSSLGRPRSWRPAKLFSRSPTRQPISSSFFRFF